MTDTTHSRALHQLLEKLQEGDESAAEQLFRAYEPFLRVVVRRKLSAALRAKFDSADVVFGSRFGGKTVRVMYFSHYVGNRLLTFLSNCFTGLNLTDMETCYKVFRREVLAQIVPHLREERFGIEPELTARAARLPGVRIFEAPITYRGRTYAEGKKITWRDGVRALWCILRYGFGR